MNVFLVVFLDDLSRPLGFHPMLHDGFIILPFPEIVRAFGHELSQDFDHPGRMQASRAFLNINQSGRCSTVGFLPV